MKSFVRLAAASAAMVSLMLAASGCSPHAQAPAQAAASTSSSGAPATPATGVADSTAALPASCQTLLASMKSCADNLTRSGSPLGPLIRASITDMRNSIASAPPAEAPSFCDTEAAAFSQRAQASHC